MAPLALGAPDTFTEIAVLELHDAALRMVSGRRLVDYLAAELRGPILASGVSITVSDGMARGLAQKRFEVVPRRFTGERLEVPGEQAAPGFSPLRIELYLVRGAERPQIQVSCAGTLVADDIGELHALGIDHAPWIGRELEGIIDFPGFTVPPGTRRGVVPDAAALAFVEAIDALEPVVAAELARLDRERRAVRDRLVVDDLRRALKGLGKRLPHLELPAVAQEAERAGPKLPRGAPVREPDDDDGGDDGGGAGVQPELFPPGPLAAVQIAPSPLEIAPGNERRVRARALDAHGRRIADAGFEWTMAGVGFSVRGEGAKPMVSIAGDVLIGAQGTLTVRAQAGDRVATSDAAVVAIARVEPELGSGVGIPDPELIDAPGELWRSRFEGERWQVNTAHEDYVALRSEPRSRVRYLLSLLAKEIVQRSYVGAGGEALEQLVAILAHAERNLRGA